jgi:trans-2,3-dihydro-3-hydroxyanthranilate isomerase
MKEQKFYQVDVFTDRAFGGNPLAVFPHAEGLTDTEMQALAREMNLSETTFVLPAERDEADFKVRIFTPKVELPFAGHPVVGTHWVLAHLGMVKLREPVTRVKLELGVGVLPGDLLVAGGRVASVVMTQKTPTFHKTLDDVSNLAAGLNIPPEAIASSPARPVQVVSTGMAQMMVPIRSLAEVQGLDVANMDVSILNRVCQSLDTQLIMVFSTETQRPEATVHARAFCHLVGIPEDPATGSASGAMGAYLVRHRVVPIDRPTVEIQSEQGLEMGRPSKITVSVDHVNGEPTVVRVSGKTVLVVEGVARF